MTLPPAGVGGLEQLPGHGGNPPCAAMGRAFPFPSFSFSLSADI